MGLEEALAGAYNEIDSRVSSAVFPILSNACDLDLSSPPRPLAHLPLLNSPTPPLILVLVYLLISVGGSFIIRTLGLKPRDKQPILLYFYILGHNLLLCCLSLFLFVAIPLEAWRLGYKFWGNAYNPKEVHMAWLIYLFYVSKFIEFGDTVIMVVRCSIRQVSFLHVYHHSTISLIWWAIAYSAPGGDAYFSATLNSGIHVAMYGYYFLAALLGPHPKLRKKYLFWGRYLTQAQMTQFVCMLLQASYGWVYQTPPVCLSKVLLVYMCTLLALFANFYVSKYFASARLEAKGMNGVGHSDDKKSK